MLCLPTRVHRRLEHLFSALPGRYFEMGNSEYSNLRLFRVLISTMLALSRITGSVLWIRVRSIWKRLRIVSTTLQRPMDSPPSVASASNGNTNLIAPSETVEETPATGGDFSEDGNLYWRRQLIHQPPWDQTYPRHRRWRDLRLILWMTSMKSQTVIMILIPTISVMRSLFVIVIESRGYVSRQHRQKRNLNVFPGHHPSESHPFRLH